jgi:membrane protein
MAQGAETETGAAPPDAGAPESPTELTKRSWWGVLKRTIKEFQDDNLTDWAAALTYYAVLALFPGVIVLVALLGLLGQYPQTFNALLDIVRQLGPASAVDTFAGPIEAVIREKEAAGALLGFGLLTALWSASGYIGAFIRAANVIYEVKEGRPFWKLRPLQILLTIAMVLLLAVVAIALVLTGPLARAVGNVVGLGDFAVTVWSIVKWPVLIVIVMAMFAVLYYVAPNVKQPQFKWVTPGGIVAVLVWIVASLGFAFYVSNFGSYNKTYGTLGGAVIFLVWLWVSNLALLFGAELDAELERERELQAGLPANEELQLPPKDPPKD